MTTAGKTIKNLLAKNGPMTTKAIASHLPNHPEFISKSHLKHSILASLKGRGALVKRIERNPASLPGLLEAEKKEKQVWVWELPSQSA